MEERGGRADKIKQNNDGGDRSDRGKRRKGRQERGRRREGELVTESLTEHISIFLIIPLDES